jgi:beta-fructofuranosidase
VVRHSLAAPRSHACTRAGPQQAIAHVLPANASDPELTEWVRPSFNPVLTAEMVPTASRRPDFGFRDPTTGWRGSDGVWRLLVGCSLGACMFKSRDYVTWHVAGVLVHAPADEPMWECACDARRA